MKRSLLAVIAGAVTWVFLAGAPAQAACDYAIGGTPPYSGSQMITDINEELGCISSAIAAGIADGDKGDITVSSSGSVWSVDSGAVGVTELSGLGTGVGTFLGTPSSSNLAAAVTGETGSGALVFGTSPTLTTPDIGTPSAGTLTNVTGLPISTGVSGLGSNVATALATPSSANLRSAVTDETGTGALMFGLTTSMADDLGCTGSQVVRRNSGDTAFECATVSGGSLGDGDYGDITVSGSGTALSIDNDTVGEPELDLVNGNTATNGDCLVARPAGTGGTLEFTTCPGAGGGISNVVEDLTPQLGGALDTNGFAIELGSGNTDTSLTRSAAGQISVEGVVVPTVSSTSTLTNKTLTAPVISTISNTGTITLPTATTTLVGRDTTDTLTNKSIAAGQITAGTLNIGNNAATVGTVELANGTANTLSASSGNLSIEGNAVYRAGGTDVALADGGTGASLADPNADRIMFWDDSAGGIDWLTVGSGLSVTGTTLSATGGGGASAGQVIQVVNTQTGAVATGTTIMPNDDTIPQNTEGTEFMTLAITPQFSNSKLKIEIVINLASSATGASDWLTAALFQDSTAGSLAASAARQSVANSPVQITYTHYMTAGTTSATTFKVRAGFSAAGTVTFNGASSGRLYGGVLASSITISEIKQ